MSTYDEPEHSEFWYDYTRNDPNRENPFKKMPVDTEKYLDFVHDVTSTESLDYAALLTRMNKLELEDDCNLPQLLTAALGLTAESGEFSEVVKKIILQGKPYNEDNVFHMKRELGDICWYIAQACMALDTTFDEIIEMNVDKLKKRYPGGEFNVHQSENRKEGDL
jgi:NTP pyrophosphatase (non-canonical NTP hydrolase)